MITYNLHTERYSVYSDDGAYLGELVTEDAPVVRLPISELVARYDRMTTSIAPEQTGVQDG